MGMPIRVGLMVPQNNTTMEHELLTWLPPGSTVRLVRIPRGKGLLNAEMLPAYRAQAVALARAFATDDIDVVAYGCTAAGFISGPGGDASLQQELADVTGKPVVTTARSMVTVLESQAKAGSSVLVTPYSTQVNERLMVFLTDAHIVVKRLRAFAVADVDALGRIAAHEVEQLAREAMGTDVDALFIACAQLPTATILSGLEREFGRPAWSSIRATAWEAERAVARRREAATV
jgi:maleate cis-trans isomerase